MSILKRGLSGAPVSRMQTKLGLEADGDFGPATEAAVKAFQKENGLAVDGIAGPDTFTAMDLPELVLLRVGSRGDTVKTLQTSLGISADGIFGNGTAKAVEEYQSKNGLVADGMAGPKTLSTMAAFSKSFTESVLVKAELSVEEERLEGDPLPELKGIELVKGDMELKAPKKSLWGKVKGLFGK